MRAILFDIGGPIDMEFAHEIAMDGAKDEETIVQITGVGPSGTIRVDENGQPKK